MNGMILSDESITSLLKDKTLEITGMPASSLQSASVDLRLGRQFALLEYWTDMEILNFNSDPKYLKVEADEFVVPAHSFILGTTMETVRTCPEISRLFRRPKLYRKNGAFYSKRRLGRPRF